MASSTSPTSGEEDNPPQGPALESLITADQSILLNTVDKLRNHGVNKYINLPQIIVCGDQSSGKSSVLEAISRISFPHGDGVCTTFPTELALRRGPNRSVKVELKPSSSRPESERAAISSYRPGTGNLEDFEQLVSNAKKHLQEHAAKDRKEHSVFEDVLHIEVTDPKWPPLSLVDLPGLISSPNPEQTQEDVTRVNNLVAKYMKNPKSVILAVASAGYELPVQKIFELIAKYDPLGNRTMCVVTNPDRAMPRSNDQPQFVSYAQNKLQGYTFKLGWHVVKNLEKSAGNQTLDDRDKSEKDFFAQAAWIEDLHRHQLGISRLRDRLSALLEQHTRSEMPGALKQINETLKESRKELSKLGPARSSSDAQKLHLVTISQRFEGLVRQAVNGHYDDSSFFLPSLLDSDPRKLRALLQNMNQDFAKYMHDRGHAKRIVKGYFEQSPILVPQLDGTLVSPTIISRNDYIQQIKSLSRRNKGKELIGSPNLSLVRDLFIDQSRPWRSLATKHLESVLHRVIQHLSLVADNVASPETAAALRRELLYDAVEERRVRMMKKLEELLKPHEKGHPITYDLLYVQNSRKLVKDGVKARLEEYQQKILQKTTEDGSTSFRSGLSIHQVMDALKLDAKDIEDVECADILNTMQAYYEGALRTFIDNVAVLAVESCLVDGLEEIFSPTVVFRMDEKTLRALGGESEHAQAERQQLTQKVEALQDAQKECSRAGAIQEPQLYSSAADIRVESQPAETTPSKSVNPGLVPSLSPSSIAFTITAAPPNGLAPFGTSSSKPVQFNFGANDISGTPTPRTEHSGAGL